MVTTFGVKKNKYSNSFGKEVVLDDLSERVSDGSFFDIGPE
jgi:hypothetical protein